MIENMPALARKATPRNQIVTGITANPIATAGMAVPHGMAVHRRGMIMTISPMLVLMKRVIQRNQIATDITANPMRIAGMAVPHGMAAHRGSMIMTINLVQLRGRIVSAIRSTISTVKSRGMLGAKACMIAIKKSGIGEEMTIMMIKTIGIGIRGIQDPSKIQLGRTDGTITAVLATTMESTILQGTAIDQQSTDELIALARSVDRRRRAAIASRHAADATST